MTIVIEGVGVDVKIRENNRFRGEIVKFFESQLSTTSSVTFFKIKH